MPISRQYAVFGQALTELRVAKELSHAELAKRAGLPASYVAACEDGDVEVDLPIMLSLVDGLDEALSELVFRFEMLMS